MVYNYKVRLADSKAHSGAKAITKVYIPTISPLLEGISATYTYYYLINYMLNNLHY